MADENKSGGLKISSREELENWLESLPPEEGGWVAVAIAARAALRVLPLIALDAPRKKDAEHKRWFESLAFAVFFAVASARVWAKYPTQLGRVNVRSAAHEAITASHLAAVPRAIAAARSAVKAAGAAAEAVTTLAAWRLHALDAVSIAATAVAGDAAFASEVAKAAQAKNVSKAQEAVKRATDEFANDIWEGVTADVNIFRHLAIPRQFVDLPLWAKSNTGFYGRTDSQLVNVAPASFHEDRRKLFHALSSDLNWGVWMGWYNRRLQGMSEPEEIELVFVTVPDEEREAGPAAANKWIKERLEELREEPTVPPKLPATIEPIIADGKIALPANPAEVDLESETLGAALTALRTQIADLAGDLDGEANIDKRVITFLRRLTENIPQAPPTQAQLFMLAHEQETVENYGKTVATEWPALLAGRYLATTLTFDRTVRQFPKWRLFKQNADKNRLTDQQRAEAPKLAADFAAALREEEAAEYVAAEIPDTFEEMSRRLDAARDEAREDRIAAGVDTLAEDAVVSIENMLKLMAETALAGVKRAANAVTKAGAAYVDSFEEGMVDQAKMEGKKDSAALVKWSKRILVGAAAGAGAKAAGIGAVIAKLMVTYPQIGKWLGPIIDLISS